MLYEVITLLGNDIAALMHELFEHLIIDGIEQDHTVVRRTGRRQIEGLGSANLIRRIVEVRGIVHGRITSYNVCYTKLLRKFIPAADAFVAMARSMVDQDLATTPHA